MFVFDLSMWFWWYSFVGNMTNCSVMKLIVLTLSSLVLSCYPESGQYQQKSKVNPALGRKTSAMFLQLLAMLLQKQFCTFEKRALSYSGAISKYFIFFYKDGQKFLQSDFGYQFQCFDFLFIGVKKPIQYRTQYILSLFLLIFLQTI